jgi:hypothetical protein
MEAGQALMAMCREDSSHVETFLSEDGGVVLVELLQNPCSEKATPSPPPQIWLSRILPPRSLDMLKKGKPLHPLNFCNPKI